MKEHFEQFAAYNRWANAPLYEAALDVEDSDYRRDLGLHFGSLQGTLNHILVGDQIWLQRLTGQGDAPARLDAILHHNLSALARARVEEDDRLGRTVADYPAGAFHGSVRYRNTSGVEFDQRLSDILTHLFNHQTHHRGQAHAALSIITRREPPSLDFVAFLRGVPAPDLRARVCA